MAGMDLASFWKDLVAVEHGIVACGTCRTSSGGDPGSPQPSWVGADFTPGGLVILLRNPGVVPATWAADTRERRLAERLDRFRRDAALESYRDLVVEMHDQMRGVGPGGRERWRQWAHPISKCIDGCSSPRDIAWVNVVKHRTPGADVKDRATSRSEEQHGIAAHLTAELQILAPRVVLAVGSPALAAVQTLRGSWKLLTIKQRLASNDDTLRVRQQIRSAGLCR